MWGRGEANTYRLVNTVPSFQAADIESSWQGTDVGVLQEVGGAHPGGGHQHQDQQAAHRLLHRDPPAVGLHLLLYSQYRFPGGKIQ